MRAGVRASAQRQRSVVLLVAVAGAPRPASCLKGGEAAKTLHAGRGARQLVAAARRESAGTAGIVTTIALTAISQSTSSMARCRGRLTRRAGHHHHPRPTAHIPRSMPYVHCQAHGHAMPLQCPSSPAGCESHVESAVKTPAGCTRCLPRALAAVPRWLWGSPSSRCLPTACPSSHRCSLQQATECSGIKPALAVPTLHWPMRSRPRCLLPPPPPGRGTVAGQGERSAQRLPASRRLPASSFHASWMDPLATDQHAETSIPHEG